MTFLYVGVAHPVGVAVRVLGQESVVRLLYVVKDVYGLDMLQQVRPPVEVPRVLVDKRPVRVQDKLSVVVFLVLS